ncbi:MAG: hypothetical protein CL561_00165 [Alphaproteobacteria bacterium]|nr:hypothetical protein [Alphaproteobacteria bacterium]|tara:strand:- start:32537 stop:32728 length:192 start_codon:yes stop_codon:yes gene_type:complete
MSERPYTSDQLLQVMQVLSAGITVLNAAYAIPLLKRVNDEYESIKNKDSVLDLAERISQNIGG